MAHVTPGTPHTCHRHYPLLSACFFNQPKVWESFSTQSVRQQVPFGQRSPMKWNIFSMSDLSQKGYEFSLLKRVSENFSYCTFWNKTENSRSAGDGLLEQSFSLAQEFHSFFTLYSSACSLVSMTSHPENPLGIDSFKARMWGQENLPEEPVTFSVKFCFFFLMFWLVSLIVLQFFLHPPNNLLLWPSPWTYQTQSKSYHRPCSFFMSFYTAGFTFNLVTWYLDIIWENFLETFSFQILKTLTFVFPWVNLVATDLSVTFQPLTADLGPCYLTVTPPPLIIQHFNQVMLSLQDSSIWDDSGPPEVVPATFSGASSFCRQLCPKIHDRETQRLALHWRQAFWSNRWPPLKIKKKKR